MDTVYRIQSKQDRTRGAYDIGGRMSGNRPDVVSRMHDAHGDWADAEHPTARQDIGISRFVKSDEFHGFDSAADLLRWFKGFMPDLLRAGYEIVALQNVTITAVGEYQVLFTFNT